jgi:regulator of chromosome condensation
MPGRTVAATVTKAASSKAAATKKAAAKATAPSTAAAKTTRKAVNGDDAKKKAPAKATATSKRKRAGDVDDAEKTEDESQTKKLKTTASTSKSAKPAAAKKATAVRPAAKAKAAKKQSSAPVEAPAKVVEDDKENAAPNGVAPAGNKRRGATAESLAESAKETTAAPPAKKPKAAAASKRVKATAKINEAPTKPLDVFVFGEGSSGELGLGSVKIEGKKPIDVRRPRLNANLAAKTAGVVQIACGGMHSLALTKDNKILSWGVNDQGALGRDTAWEGGLRDVSKDDESDSDDDDDDTGLNPNESTPKEIDTSEVADDTTFVQVAASDSASFALTDDGRVYGWGTFRVSV